MTHNHLFTLSDLEEARAIVYSTVAPTPQYAWPLLRDQSGTEVWIKHENHTPTGSFKVRGGLVFVEELRRRNELSNGLITATRGNHGQSIPYAASRFSVPVTVVVPRGNSIEKNRAMEAWGAELIELSNSRMLKGNRQGENQPTTLKRTSTICARSRRATVILVGGWAMLRDFMKGP